MKTTKPIHKVIYLTTLLFSIFPHICHSESELCHPQDKKALLNLKKGFNNPWVFHTWDPQTDCCAHWDGVHCDEKTNRVATLEAYFGGTDLAGAIPPAIGGLAYLDTLWWHISPNLTGPLPLSLTNLRRLRFLVINRANLSGPIPGFLGDLPSLEFLDFSFNNLSGSIPSTLTKPPRLRVLDLSRNRLTGPIPPSLGSFKGFDTHLDLSHNQLSGKIPAELGNTDFSTVDLSRNRLEGDASPLFGGDKNMTQRVSLSRNLLEFDLSGVEFPKGMYGLDLSHNKIFGSIPEGLTELKYLSGLNVSYNRLCGKIPVGGALQGFDNTTYFHNRCLCGAPLTISCKN